MTDEERNKIEQDIFMHGLFQFRKYDKFLIDNLIENKITFGSAQNFNDPFDCNLPINVECTESAVQNLVIEASFKKNLFDLSFIAKFSRELFNNPIMLKEEIQNLIFNHRRFSCFNLAKNDHHLRNSLFWANYANKHKGICMKFSGDLLKYYYEYHRRKIMLIPIEYCADETIPKFNYILNRHSREKFASQYFFGTKSFEWKGEEEIRFIYHSDIKLTAPFINYEFDPICLEKVYVGCKINDEELAVLLNSLSHPKYEHVEIFRLVIDDKKFILNTTEIKKRNITSKKSRSHSGKRLSYFVV